MLDFISSGRGGPFGGASGHLSRSGLLVMGTVGDNTLVAGPNEKRHGVEPGLVWVGHRSLGIGEC